MRILLDSGAYTARNEGTSIDRGEYIAFVKDNAANIDAYMNLDIIPESHRPELIEAAAAKSYANQQAMKDAGLHPIPVFHRGEGFPWIERYLADGEKYIALAPRANGYHAIPWLADVFSLLKDSKGRPLVKVHGLGITTPSILRRYPWASVDSSTWLKQSRVGQIPVPLYQNGKPDYGLRHDVFAITDRSRGRQCRHIDDADDFELDWINRYLNEEVGIDIGEARYSFEHRYKVWIAYLKALASYYGVDIYFVTNVNWWQHVLLGECQVQHRLLSYARLKDQSDDCLESYVMGRLPPARPRKRPTDRYSDSYTAFRALALWRRLKAYEGRIE